MHAMSPSAKPSVPEQQDPLTETCITTEQVFDGGMLKVWRDRVTLPDGGQSWREYVKHPGAVVVAAVLPDGSLVFERQFRYPLHRSFLELPAGKIDPGEDILACAIRELREETGYEAAHWEYLGVMHACIGYSDERIEMFLATDLTHVGHCWDEGEFLEILQFQPEDARAAVLDGRITDSKTITTLFHVLPRLGG